MEALAKEVEEEDTEEGRGHLTGLGGLAKCFVPASCIAAVSCDRRRPGTEKERRWHGEWSPGVALDECQRMGWDRMTCRMQVPRLEENMATSRVVLGPVATGVHCKPPSWFLDAVELSSDLLGRMTLKALPVVAQDGIIRCHRYTSLDHSRAEKERSDRRDGGIHGLSLPRATSTSLGDLDHDVRYV